MKSTHPPSLIARKNIDQLRNYAAHKIIKPHEFHNLTIHDHRLLVIAANSEDRNKMPVYSAA